MTDKWNGQGLPPVGEQCEGLPCDTNVEWHKVIYVAPDPVQRGAKYYIGVYLGGDRSGKVDYFKCFRPLKSEAERKRDEAVEEMKAVFDKRVCIPQDVIFEALHDAGYRKINELTDEQINVHALHLNIPLHQESSFMDGAKWARSQIMGEKS